MKDPTLYLLDIIRYYLKIYRKAFNDTELYKVLLSDPTFPSLASICHTLEFYGLNSEAFKVEKANIDQIRGCIIHTSSHGGHFFIVINIDGNSITLFDRKCYKISKQQFLNLWDGIILAVHEPKGNNKKTSLEKIKWYTVLLWIAAIISVITCASLSITIVNILLDVAGIYLCSNLIRHRIDLPHNDRLCKIGKKFDCEYVSSKQPLSNVLHINLDEVGFCYFCWDLSVIIAYENNVIIIVGSVIAILFSILLAIYQVVRIKIYCIYCFCIYVICLIKGFVSYSSLSSLSTPNIHKLLITTILAFTIAIVSCILFSRLERLKYNYLENSINLLKIKRVPEVYRALSSQKRILGKTYLQGLKYGEEKVDCEIVIFASLSCKYCKQAIKDASMLIERFPKKFNCIVILTKSVNKEADYNKELTVIDDYLHGNKNIISLTKDKTSGKIEGFSNLAKNLFNEMEREVHEFSIMSFPFIFVNGYELPNLYRITDYQYINSGVYIH